jgi:hypothetical protein
MDTVHECPAEKIKYLGKCPNKKCVAYHADIDSGCIVQKVKIPTLYSIAAYLGINNCDAKKQYKIGLNKLQKSLDFTNAANAVFGNLNCCSKCGITINIPNVFLCENAVMCEARVKFYNHYRRKYPFYLVKLNPNKFWNALNDSDCKKYIKSKVLKMATSLQQS